MGPARARSGRPSPRPCALTAAAGALSGWPRSSAITRRPQSRECAGLVGWSMRCSPYRRGSRTTVAEGGWGYQLAGCADGGWCGYEAHPHRCAEDPAGAPLGGGPAGRPARPRCGPCQGAGPCPAGLRAAPERRTSDSGKRAMTSPMAPGIPLAIAVVAALVVAALRAAARRPGSPGVPSTRPAPVTVTADQRPPRPTVTTGTHDRAVRQRARPPRPPGRPPRAVEQAQHIFHELHADGRNALCVVCDSQYGPA
jgi:hypothetical protein